MKEKKSNDAFYYVLIKKNRKRIKELNPVNDIHNAYIKERIEFLLEIGTKQIRQGRRKVSINGTRPLPININSAIRRLLKEIPKYLEKYFPRFEADKKSGELERICVGEQLSLEFSRALDSLPIGESQNLTPAERRGIMKRISAPLESSFEYEKIKEFF